MEKLLFCLILFFSLSACANLREEIVRRENTTALVAIATAKVSDLDKMEGARTPLMLAAESCNVAAATALIARGVPLGSSNWEGKTALHYASEGKCFLVVSALLENGAKSNPIDNDGRTPLHFTACQRDGRIASLLIAAGADPKIQDNDRKTVNMYAQECAPDVFLYNGEKGKE